ncbi:heavy metal translocating P-type ATPase [Blastopirellula marina]|uniref:P-type Zn(2+) transporter n=1 Tax=Blastopirellula marina TaxID=124 RepID=A0A2S8G0Q8_9BACT|nr:cation-translocating P-type ATPase [Blastopirellula marina]PQO38032.1 heavy metal translocating P-type ATPase [Blastopirellula marina]PTL44688.1 cation-transporting P-type ATPase [Blastopirellula marina]
MSSVSVAKRIQDDLDAGLSAYEKWRMGIRFGTALVAASFLGVGLLIDRFMPVEQHALAATFQAAAALLVIAPILWEAVYGLFQESPEYYSSQLVCVAALAAFAVGDFTTAVIVPVILSVAFFLEERSILGANSAIAGLQALQSNQARRITAGGEEQTVAAADLRPGDLIVIGPGESIPADATVVQGHSAIDQSSITGESTPEEVEPESSIFAGSMNLTGVLRAEVTKAGDQTTIAKVLELFQEAERSKTRTLRLVEQYAKYFVLAVMLIAGITLFLTHDVTRAITVLVVGCPGPFLIAGPAAMVAALAVASRNGILVKNARFLEALSEVNSVVFDKTGTVTTGQLEVCHVVPFQGDEANVIDQVLAGTLANHHPVSKAIARYGAQRERTATEASLVEEIAGRGVRIRYPDERVVLLGRESWLNAEGIATQEVVHSGPQVWAAEVMGEQSRLLGCICLSDQPRPESAHVVQTLRSLGVERTVLLTGDRHAVAQQIGDQVGVDEIVSEVLPAEKLRVVELEKQAGYDVMVVGDGINDAPALAAGNVGVAMGVGGADITMRSADIVLMTHHLDRLPLAMVLSAKTKTTIHRNVLIGAGLTLVMLGLASAGSITPISGAILQNVGEAFVIVNSAAILRWNGKI